VQIILHRLVVHLLTMGRSTTSFWCQSATTSKKQEEECSFIQQWESQQGANECQHKMEIVSNVVGQ
jgi:hypothetical protein